MIQLSRCIHYLGGVISSVAVDSLVQVLDLKEHRLSNLLVMGSVSVVRHDLDGAVEYLNASRRIIKADPHDCLSPY